MMSLTCQNIGQARYDLVSCGCSSSSFSKKNSINTSVNPNKGFELHKLVGSRRDVSLFRKRVVSTKSPEAVLNGPAASVVESNSGDPILVSSLLEVVAEDLLTLNKNLQSIVGADNPVLMSAAEQIFGAGGKRMRPALVFLVSRATAQIAELKELTSEHRRLAEIRNH